MNQSSGAVEGRGRYYPELDGLRALAALMVMAFHLAQAGIPLPGPVTFGKTGVDLFFVLSGFLITGILFDTRDDSHFFKRFFARRSLRIFPVFYLVVAILLALTPIVHYEWRAGHLLFLVYMGNFLGNHDFSLYEVLSAAHPTFKVAIGHFWSLCVGAVLSALAFCGVDGARPDQAAVDCGGHCGAGAGIALRDGCVN